MLIEYFDNKAKKLINLENLDILIGWSGFSLKSFEYKKKSVLNEKRSTILTPIKYS